MPIATYLDHGIPVTAENLKSALSGAAEKQITIVHVFRDHNEEMYALVGRDFTLSTYNRYEAALTNVEKFLHYKYKVKDIPVDKLCYSFKADYAFYLKAVRHISHNTAMRYVKYFKKVVLLCVKNGWLRRYPFFAFKVKFEEVERKPLDESELEAIANKNFTNYRQKKVRTIFLFCCYTGLARMGRQKPASKGHNCRSRR